MRRRDFIKAIAGSVAATPFGARAQHPSASRRIGVLMPFARDDRHAKLWLDAFVQSLRNLGWSDGTNLRYDVRYSEGRPDLLPALASDLVSAQNDVIVTWAAQPVDALRAATRTTPIVMAGIGDALGPGYVASLAHPGGNITGLTIVATDQTGKRLQLLQQMIPDFARVAVIWNPGASGHVFQMKDLPEAARNLGIALQSLPVRAVGEIEAALNSSTAERAQGIYLMEDPMIQSRRAQIVEFAIQNRLPIIGEFKPVVEAGALMSYGPNQLDLWQRAASYVDKILKGASPAELPVEQPNKYDLAINLKTAKAIGLTVPMPLTVAATDIIE
jgi:putative ABC transport system substrate-binding protein